MRRHIPAAFGKLVDIRGEKAWRQIRVLKGIAESALGFVRCGMSRCGARCVAGVHARVMLSVASGCAGQAFCALFHVSPAYFTANFSLSVADREKAG